MQLSLLWHVQTDHSHYHNAALCPREKSMHVLCIFRKTASARPSRWNMASPTGSLRGW